MLTSIFSFSHNLFYPSQNKFQFSATFILLSANAYNLDQSKILSFGRELTHHLEMLAIRLGVNFVAW